jgi:hypothetical protein
MRRIYCLFLVFAALSSELGAQTTFITQLTGGNWNLGTTWDQTGCASGCVAGVDYPGPNDFAIILVQAGSSVNIPRGSNFTVKDLLVAGDVGGIIRCSGVAGTATLTINGQLSGVLSDLSDYAEPTQNVFQVTASNLNLVFTGSNLDDPISGAVITSWGHISPIYRTTFNPGIGSTVRVDSYSVRSSATVQSGTLQINTGQNIRDFSGASQFIVNASSTANLLGAINGNGSTSSTFSTATINGTLTTGSVGYLNSATFTLGSAGVINVGFNGANQSEGWWHQLASPTTLSISATSTVNYLSNTTQNIYATTYGNLSLTSSSAVIKTLSGSGLTLQGNLSIGSNVTFSPSTQVDFTGSVAQSISGTGTLNFNGGLEVNKTSSSLTLNKAVSVSGFTVTSGTLNLGDVTTSLTGATSNSGIITSGSAGTVQVTGAASFFGAGSTAVNNLTIASGTTTFTGSSSISGNLVNNGSLVLSSTSTVTFLGGSAQTISGNAMTFGNIVVNKPSATLSNNANIELTGTLTMTTGTFDVDGAGSGNFTLNSDTNGDAAIGPMAGGSIIGEVTFERYFNNTSTRWRNLAFPVSSVTYAELGTTLTLNTNSLAIYNELTAGNVDQGWTVVSGGTLNSARGHSAWMYNIQPITISVKGPLLQTTPAQSGSPYNFGVTYFDDVTQAATQDGWNLVPNPFASPIDWTNSGWVKTNLNAAAAIWDVENNVYRYSNVDWNGIVAQGQAFWIQTNASGPVLTATESVKESVADPVFYRQAAEQSRLLISLVSGNDVDKAVVQFNDEATTEFDGNFDAYKLKNGIFNLSSLTNDGVNLAANALPKAICTSNVRLDVTNAKPGSYTLRFEGLDSFSEINSLTLIDHFTDQTVSLLESTAYSFEISDDPASYGSKRFEIAFDFVDQNETPTVTLEDGRLISNYADGNQWYFNNALIPGATGSTFVPTERGEYYTVVNDGICEMRSLSIEMSEESSRIFPNPATTSLKVDVRGLQNSNEPGEIYIHSVQGQLLINQNFTRDDGIVEIGVQHMKPGVYILTLVTNGFTLQKSKVIIR